MRAKLGTAPGRGVQAAGHPDRLLTTALGVVVVASWVAVVVGPAGMGVGPVLFVLAWTVMMVAMMLPSASPLVLLYRRGASTIDTALLTTGYLAVWAAAGVPAYIAMEAMPMWLSPVALAAAGIYQLTPLKASCLRRCRSPVDFLMQRWGRGPFRLGFEHGLSCLGCCWALMAVLVVVGMMGLAWVVGLTALVAWEKLAPHGVLVSRLAGIAFLVAAIVQVIS
jgi:predicted metal-binding membrane protein